MENKYIGIKFLEAKEMNLGDYNIYRGWKLPEDERHDREGYLVKYADGYESWSPKEIFENSYLKLEDNPKLPSGVSIGPKMVEGFIKEIHVSTIGDKTTLVRVVLVNGFEIIESSACVDKANYSEEIGADVCLSKIKDKIWNLLGFLLQTAVGGVNGK